MSNKLYNVFLMKQYSPDQARLIDIYCAEPQKFLALADKLIKEKKIDRDQAIYIGAQKNGLANLEAFDRYYRTLRNQKFEQAYIVGFAFRGESILSAVAEYFPRIKTKYNHKQCHEIATLLGGIGKLEELSKYIQANVAKPLNEEKILQIVKRPKGAICIHLIRLNASLLDKAIQLATQRDELEDFEKGLDSLFVSENLKSMESRFIQYLTRYCEKKPASPLPAIPAETSVASPSQFFEPQGVPVARPAFCYRRKVQGPFFPFIPPDPDFKRAPSPPPMLSEPDATLLFSDEPPCKLALTEEEEFPTFELGGYSPL